MVALVAAVAASASQAPLAKPGMEERAELLRRCALVLWVAL